MGEQLGTKLVGSTTYKKLFRSSLGPDDIVPCVIEDDAAKAWLMGYAMIDDASTGFKKRYTNGGAITGACILMEDVTVTLAGGNVTANACRDGSVDSSMVLDLSGAAADATFKAALPKVSWD